MPSAIMKTALLASMLAGFGTAQAHSPQQPVHYACPANQELIVQRNSLKARVSLAGRTYDLQRKRSALGDKYLGPSAALIIDGASAIFVADDHLDVGTCVKSTSVTSLS